MDQKIVAVFIRFENKSERTVFAHGFKNLGDTRRAAFGKTDFFEEFTDPEVCGIGGSLPCPP